eukprot:gene29346-33140_t
MQLLLQRRHGDATTHRRITVALHFHGRVQRLFALPALAVLVVFLLQRFARHTQLAQAGAVPAILAVLAAVRILALERGDLVADALDAPLRAANKPNIDPKAVMFQTARKSPRVGSNGGTAAELVGSYDSVARRIEAFHAAGIELFMLQFQPFEAEMRRFAEEVIPRVRVLEAEGFAPIAARGRSSGSDRSSVMLSQRQYLAISWIAPAVLLVIWEALARFGYIAPFVLPAPSKVLLTGFKLATSGTLVNDLVV